jgi:hypothetical protein
MWSIIVLLVLFIPILAIVLDSQLGRALAARLERGRLAEGDDIAAERLAYLENEVERLSGELMRLEEESRFVTRLLTERAGGDDAGSIEAELDRLRPGGPTSSQGGGPDPSGEPGAGRGAGG